MGAERSGGARALPARLEVLRQFLPRLVASAARELAKLGAIAVVADVDPVVTYVEVAYSSAPSWTDFLEETVMKIDGGCHCGAITYEAEIDPETVTICHCTDCQTLSGSAFRTAVPARKDVFRLLTGKPKIYVKTAESGNKRVQAFCAECGSPIYSSAVTDPPVFMIRVGTIRQRAELAPKSRIWCRSALGWLNHVASIKQFAQQPPA